MRFVPVAVLLVCLGCQKSPYGPFDAGHDVHVIVTADPPPQKGLAVRPVCTLGPQVAKSPKRLLRKGGDVAVEVAVFRVPTGKHRFSVWEPRTSTGARTELKVEHELWVVLTLEPQEPEGQLDVYDEPPDDDIVVWRSLVAVPD